MGLLIACFLSIGILLVSFVFSAWLLLSGTVDQLEAPEGMSKQTQVLVRMAWNALMQITNVVILYGAWQMRNLRSLGWAKTACILALIPCLGPCLLAGIPIGIWGLLELKDARVQEAFDS